MSEINEAHKLGDRVIMNHPTLKGVIGHIAEIRHGSYKGAPKTYTIDYQHPKHKSDHVSSIQLDSKYFKQHPVGQLGESHEEHPIITEYKKLIKQDIGSLRGLIKSQHRGPVDTSEYKTKDHAASAYLRNKHGDKRVSAAFGLSESEVNELSIDTLKSYSDKAGQKADKLAKQGENSKNLKTSYKKFRDATMTLASKARADKKVREKEWQDKTK